MDIPGPRARVPLNVEIHGERHLGTFQLSEIGRGRRYSQGGQRGRRTTRSCTGHQHRIHVLGLRSVSTRGIDIQSGEFSPIVPQSTAAVKKVLIPGHVNFSGWSTSHRSLTPVICQLTIAMDTNVDRIVAAVSARRKVRIYPRDANAAHEQRTSYELAMSIRTDTTRSRRTLSGESSCSDRASGRMRRTRPGRR